MSDFYRELSDDLPQYPIILIAFLRFPRYNCTKKAMELEWILALVLFCILHLVLAIMLLQDLANRERVLGVERHHGL